MPPAPARFLCLLAFLLILAGPCPATEEEPFRIAHYEQVNGQAVVARPEIRVTSLYYGGPVTNAVVLSHTLPGFLAALPSHSRAIDTVAPRYPARPPTRYQVSSWTTRNGLPANKIRALWCASDGFLWVGTEAGIARFDGFDFETFTPANTPEMRAHGTVGRTFFEDRPGRLWIGTERGLLCRESGRFVQIAGSAELETGRVNGFARRTGGGFWMAADRGLAFWDGTRFQWMSLPEVRRPFALTEDSHGTLWVGATNGLHAVDLRTSRVTGSLSNEGLHGIPGQRASVYGILFDREGRLWVGVSQTSEIPPVPQPRRLRWSDHGPEVNVLPLNARFVQDWRGAIYASLQAGPGGLVAIEGQPPRTSHIAVGHGESVHCLSLDDSQNLWIGTQNGLLRLRRETFGTFQLSGPTGLANGFSLHAGADGSVWMAGQEWHGRWMGRDLILYDHHHERPALAMTSADATGAMWRGTHPVGVTRVSHMLRCWSEQTPVTTEFEKAGAIYALAPDPHGLAWIGGEQGLYRFNHRLELQAVAGAGVRDIRVLLAESVTNLWIGTAHGELFLHQPSGTRRVPNPAPSSPGPIWGLLRNQDGTLCLATDTGLWALHEGRLLHLPWIKGPASTPITGLLEDASGNLWLSHPEGVSRIDPLEFGRTLREPGYRPALRHFDTSDGISALEPCRVPASAVRTADGRLWFGRRTGIVVVDPHQVPDAEPTLRITIDRVLFGTEPMAVTEGAGLVWPAGLRRDLEVHFASSHLGDARQPRFSHRLDGHDAEWRHEGVLRSARYSDLRPGNYQFRVRVRFPNGRLSPEEGVVRFEIPARIWETFAFKVAAGAGGALALGSLMAWRVRSRRLSLEMERSLALKRDRARIARDIHDHFGARLTEMALRDGAFTENRGRVREMLNALNDLVWSVHPDQDTLSSLVEHLSDLAARFLAPTSLELELDLPSAVPARAVSGRWRSDVAALLSEALRNVIQHANAQRVVVRVVIPGERLILEVQDDGRGCGGTGDRMESSRAPVDSAGTKDGPNPPPIEPTPRGGRRGLSDRCAELGGTVRMEAAPGRGTRVIFDLPLEPLRSRDGFL